MNAFPMFGSETITNRIRNFSQLINVPLISYCFNMVLRYLKSYSTLIVLSSTLPCLILTIIYLMPLSCLTEINTSFD